MKYYITTTGFIRDKEKTLHCEHYSHFTRSLFLLLYLFSKTIAGAPKKVEEPRRGTIFVRGQSNLSSFRAKLLSSLIFLCVPSSPVFVFVLLIISFLKSYFLIHFFTTTTLSGAAQRTYFPYSTQLVLA